MKVRVFVQRAILRAIQDSASLRTSPLRLRKRSPNRERKRSASPNQASNASADPSSLYVVDEAELNRAEQMRVGDRCHSRKELIRSSARIPARPDRAYQPEQSPGPQEAASCARKGRRP